MKKLIFYSLFLIIICSGTFAQSVGIGTNTPDSVLTVNGSSHVLVNSVTDRKTKTTNFQMTSGAGSGKILQGDAAGNASWVTVPGTHYVGENYGGGIVFFVYDNGLHGLIAATSDQSSGVQWYNGTYRYTGAAGDGLKAGEMNTALIVASQLPDNATGNFAAKVCADYSTTADGITYGDWYLPSKYELNLLYQQKTLVGGFANNYYRTSTEIDNALAWVQQFSTGEQGSGSKIGIFFAVRAIRSF